MQIMPPKRTPAEASNVPATRPTTRQSGRTRAPSSKAQASRPKKTTPKTPKGAKVAKNTRKTVVGGAATPSADDDASARRPKASTGRSVHFTPPWSDSLANREENLPGGVVDLTEIGARDFPAQHTGTPGGVVARNTT